MEEEVVRERFVVPDEAYNALKLLRVPWSKKTMQIFGVYLVITVESRVKKILYLRTKCHLIMPPKLNKTIRCKSNVFYLKKKLENWCEIPTDKFQKCKTDSSFALGTIICELVRCHQHEMRLSPCF